MAKKKGKKVRISPGEDDALLRTRWTVNRNSKLSLFLAAFTGSIPTPIGNISGGSIVGVLIGGVLLALSAEFWRGVARTSD